MAGDPLCVQFGGSAALILCDDGALRQWLHQHFRHCLGDAASAVVTYQVTIEDEAVQLWRDGDPLYHTPWSSLVEHLMYGLAAALTAHCCNTGRRLD